MMASSAMEPSLIDGKLGGRLDDQLAPGSGRESMTRARARAAPGKSQIKRGREDANCQFALPRAQTIETALFWTKRDAGLSD